MSERLPTGVVTFVFTDIEGSTRLVQALGERYGDVLADQRAIMRAAWTRHNGAEQSTEGDSFFVAFASAVDAVAAIADAQRALATHAWPDGVSVRVRAGLHTGQALIVDDDYFGIEVHRAARIAAAAHGGQTVLSKATADAVAGALPAGVSLIDLGEHRLKDLEQPEWVHQLVVDGLQPEFAPLRSLETPTNLPEPSTPLLGRDREVSELDAMLARDDTRLITLTGPGGTGKTRLALDVASRVRDRFKNGVFFVSLASATATHEAMASLAQALGVELGAQPPAERIASELRARSVLLVLDNFEQVVVAAPAIAGLLRDAPRVKALVTSQVALRIGVEREYPVAPLGLPPNDDVDAVTASPAASLFVERARAVKPSFAVTADNARAIASICARLDGLPLAIELAAARVKTLQPEQILERLSNALTLLQGGSRDLPERQQTLRNAIAWSVDLLDADAATLFRRFAVFPGGALLDAVEHVAGDEAVALTALDALVDHSLVRASDDGRFSMLGTIRSYAEEMLDTSPGERDATRMRQASYLADLAERSDAALRGAAQAEWRARLEAETPNVRAALAWCLDDGGAEPERRTIGARIAAGLGWYWYTHADALEGSRWLDIARANVPDASDDVRMRLLHRLGVLYDTRGMFREAIGVLEESLAVARGTGDGAAIATALNSLGAATRSAGDPARARALFEESLALRRAIGDERGQAGPIHNLGVIALDEGDADRAIALYEESTSIDRACGDDWGVALGRSGVGEALMLRGDLDGAEQRFRESLVCHVQLDERDRLAEALSHLGGVADARAEAARSARLAGAAWAMWAATGLPPAGPDLERFRNRSARARATLGEAEYDRAWREGEAMTLEQAVAYATGERHFTDFRAGLH